MFSIQKDYALLGVAYNSDEDTIKKAYKKKALKMHPDRGGDAEEFQNLSNAYQRILNHKQNRQDLSSMQTNVSTNPFNEDIFKFVFSSNGNFGNGIFFSEQTQTFKPNKRIRIRTQIINGEKKTIVEEYYT